MTVAVTYIYRCVEVTSADLDMTIQIQEVRGREYVTAFPAVTEADELGGDGDCNAHGNTTQGATAGDVADDTTDHITDKDGEHVIILRKRSQR